MSLGGRNQVDDDFQAGVAASAQPAFQSMMQRLAKKDGATTAKSKISKLPAQSSRRKNLTDRLMARPASQPNMPLAQLGNSMQPSAAVASQPLIEQLVSQAQPVADASNLNQLAIQTPAPQYRPSVIIDPTLLAQQAILARPMRPSFTGQPLMSREVPISGQGSSGLAYPGGLLTVPSYTSRYEAVDSGGSGGGGGDSGGSSGYSGPATYGSNESLSNGLVGSLLGLSSQPSFDVVVENAGTYAGMPAYGYGSSMTGVGNPGESYIGGPTSAETGIGIPGESYFGGPTSAETGIGIPGESYFGGGFTSSDTGIGNPGESYGGGYTSSDTGIGNPGESYGGGYTSSDTGIGNPGESASDTSSTDSSSTDSSSTDSSSSDSGGGDSGGGDSGGGDSGWAKGGKVTSNRLKGRNPKGPDDGYGALEDGEYVIRKKAVKKYGEGLMSMINSGKF